MYLFRIIRVVRISWRVTMHHVMWVRTCHPAPGRRTVTELWPVNRTMSAWTVGVVDNVVEENHVTAAVIGGIASRGVVVATVVVAARSHWWIVSWGWKEVEFYYFSEWILFMSQDCNIIVFLLVLLLIYIIDRPRSNIQKILIIHTLLAMRLNVNSMWVRDNWRDY